MPSPSTILNNARDDSGTDRPSKRQRTAVSDAATPGREVGLMRKTIEDNHVSFLGSASGIHFIRSVYAAVGDRRPGDRDNLQNPEGDIVPGEDDRLASEDVDTIAVSIWQSDEVDTSSAQPLITFDDVVQWSQSYFDNWFPAYPFLHAPSILDYFERFANSQGQMQEGDGHVFELAILRAIMSISLADRRQLGATELRPVPSMLVFSSFKAAMESVQLALSTRASILSLQAVLCVQLFLLSMLRHNAASRFGGLITRMVYHLGLHRCPERYTAFSPAEMMIRKRIFWSVYCMDRYINQSLGLPLTLRDDDLDVCFLDNEVHAARSKTSDLDDRLVLLNLLSKHAEVKGLIVELLHKALSHRQSNHDQSLLIQSKLTKWSNQVEAYLDLDNDESSPLSKFHEMMLKVLKQDCVIALNRPLLTSPRKSSDHNAALHTCVAAARSTIMGLSNFLRRSDGSDGEELVPLLWPSFTWAIWMSTFVIIFATIEEEIPRKVAARLTDRSLEILKHLSRRGSVWPNACEVAIRELRAKLLEPQPGSQSLTESSRTQSITHHESPSTERYSLRPTTLQREPADTDPLIQITDNELSGQRRNRHNAMAPSGRYFSGDPTVTNGTIISNAGGLHSNVTTGPLNVVDTMRNSWNMQQAPDWLEQATYATADQIDLFQGFEIPFWMGDDQYNSLIGNS